MTRIPPFWSKIGLFRTSCGGELEAVPGGFQNPYPFARLGRGGDMRPLLGKRMAPPKKQDGNEAQSLQELKRAIHVSGPQPDPY